MRAHVNVGVWNTLALCLYFLTCGQRTEMKGNRRNKNLGDILKATHSHSNDLQESWQGRGGALGIAG